MNIVRVIPLILFFSACSNTSSNIPPNFYGDYFAGLEAEKITSYDTALLDYDLTSPDGKNLHFSNCLQVDELKDSDVLESEYHLYKMLKQNCKALRIYFKASSSAASYLDELLINKDISNLPATAYPYVNDYDRSARLDKKLTDYQKKLESKVSSDGSIDVLTEVDSLIYQIIATGDFNGDEIEDALIRIDWHVIDAFGKGSRLIMITKKSSGENFQEITFD